MDIEACIEPIKVRRLNYKKAPLAIIYNPNSGNRRNLLPMIEKRLQKEGINYELFAT